MEKRLLYLMAVAVMVVLSAGCGNSTTGNENETDGNNAAREAAWAYLKEKGWEATAKGDWQSAEVTTAVASDYYELLDPFYEGEEVLAVAFEEKENAVIAPPTILVAEDTNKVIGYMPSE